MDKRLVKVVWVDAYDPDKSSENSAWYSEADLDEKNEWRVEVTSVGYIKSHTKLYLTLVADYIPEQDGEFTYGRPTRIPVKWIERIEDLEVKALT